MNYVNLIQIKNKHTMSEFQPQKSKALKTGTFIQVNIKELCQGASESKTPSV